MKKSISLVVLLFVTATAFAQERVRHFEVSANSSIVTLTNYPSLSLFEDPTSTYSSWSQGLNLGYVIKKNSFGLLLQNTSFNTSAIALRENARCISAGLYVRHYEPLTNHLELMAGLNVGMNFVQNTYYSNNSFHTSEWRTGLDCQAELGLMYRMSNGIFFGTSTGFNLAGSLNRANIETPAGWGENTNMNFGGYRVSLTFGIRF